MPSPTTSAPTSGLNCTRLAQKLMRVFGSHLQSCLTGHMFSLQRESKWHSFAFPLGTPICSGGGRREGWETRSEGAAASFLSRLRQRGGRCLDRRAERGSKGRSGNKTEGWKEERKG